MATQNTSLKGIHQLIYPLKPQTTQKHQQGSKSNFQHADNGLMYSNTFAVSFSSLSMILLSVFIFLAHISSPDLLKQNTVIKAIRAQFTQHGAGFSSSSQTKGLTHHPNKIENYANLFKLLTGVKTNTLNQQITISIPYETAFYKHDNQIKAKLAETLSQLSGKIRSNKQKVKIRLYFTAPVFQENNWNAFLAKSAAIYRLFIDSHLKESDINIQTHQCSQTTAKCRAITITIYTENPVS